MNHREYPTMPTFVHLDYESSVTRLKVLRGKVFALTSTPDQRRKTAIARILIDLDHDPTVWDRMVADFGNPLEGPA